MSEIRVPITRLRFKDPITAGMSPYVLLGLVPLLRKTGEDHPPIDVDSPCPACGTRTALDGRHRWIASVMAGRHDILAEEDDSVTDLAAVRERTSPAA
jgi:hypothetical protein